MEHYAAEFPQVELSIVFNDTYQNLKLLEQGKLDLVVGIGAQNADSSRIRRFIREMQTAVNHIQNNVAIWTN